MIHGVFICGNHSSVSLGKRPGDHLSVLIRVFGLYLSSAGVRERFHYEGSVGLCKMCVWIIDVS